MIKTFLRFLLVSLIFMIGSLGIGYAQELSKAQVTRGNISASKIGQFSLRNDGEDLIKPIGSAIPLPSKVEGKVEEIKKEVSPREVSPRVEGMRPKLSKIAEISEVVPPELKEVKEEESKRLGLKFAEGEEELPKVIVKAKPPAKPQAVMPEGSRYFLQLAPGEEFLPKVTPGKPISPISPIKPTRPITPSPVEEEEEIIPPVPPPPAEETVTKKPEFAFQRINPVLRWGIILSGLFTLILFLFVRYLWRQKELVSLAEIGGIAVEKPAQYKSLVEDIKELQAGYREFEKTIENVEKKLSPVASLKGTSIDEVVSETSKEALKPLESGIKELQGSYQGLEKMFGEFDKRLAPLDALKGLSVKELAYQTSMELYKPIENEFKKMQVSNERMMIEIEDKIERKIEPINKKNKGLEKTLSEIESRLITVDSMVSSLPRTEGVIAKPVLKTEEAKLPTNKDKKNREILHSQIYKLSDEGLSIDEIAQRTKLGKGEVRLILGLRKK
ncbi:MAG: hypothetical protein QME42_11585 [bacterium]|nr:hypothetical protein [bacterium]